MVDIDKESFLLNPNCSEVVWRLKGISQTHKGTNQEAYSVFIKQILRVFASLEWDQMRINRSKIFYIKGDGGPEILATSYFYAIDLINKIRDPREVDTEELEDRFINEGGYDPNISKNWKLIINKPLNSADPPTDTEKILTRIWSHFKAPKKPRKKSTSPKKSTSKILPSSSWLAKIKSTFDTYLRVDYISKGRSMTYAGKLGGFREKITEYAKIDPKCALEGFRYLIDKIPKVFDAVHDSYGSLGDHIEDVLKDTLELALKMSSEERNKIFHWFFELWDTDTHGYFSCIDRVFLITVKQRDDLLNLDEILEEYIQTPKIQSILKLVPSPKLDCCLHYPLRKIHALLFPLKIKLGKLEEAVHFAEKSIPITDEYFLLVDLLIKYNQSAKALALAQEKLPLASGTYETRLEQLILNIKAQDYPSIDESND